MREKHCFYMKKFELKSNLLRQIGAQSADWMNHNVCYRQICTESLQVHHMNKVRLSSIYVEKRTFHLRSNIFHRNSWHGSDAPF